MSDSDAKVTESDAAGLSADRKRKFRSVSATGSFGSLLEIEESSIGSIGNGDQERAFSFGTATLFRGESPPRSPAPRPTSCCHSSSSRPSNHHDASTTLAASSDQPTSSHHKGRLTSVTTVESDKESHLPKKKRAIVSSDQNPIYGSTTQHDAPSTKLTSGSQIFRPFDSLSTLSHGSMFSQDHISSYSSQASPFFSFSTRSSLLGKNVEPMASSSYGGKVVESGTEAVRDDGGVLLSVSSKPAFRGTSHEELRWQNYQYGFRGNNFGATLSSTSSSGFNQIPPLAFGQTNVQRNTVFHQSNMINITVPSFGFGQQSFTGQLFLLCLNNGPGFGFGQTFPCIIAFPQSAPAFSTQNTSTQRPNGFGGFTGT